MREEPLINDIKEP
jgi:hypothetical protein